MIPVKPSPKDLLFLAKTRLTPELLSFAACTLAIHPHGERGMCSVVAAAHKWWAADDAASELRPLYKIVEGLPWEEDGRGYLKRFEERGPERGQHDRILCLKRMEAWLDARRWWLINQAVDSACYRAAREQDASFAVVVDGMQVVMQDAKAVRPIDSRLECIVQFWKDCENGEVEVQIRRDGASSEWRRVSPSEATK